MHILIFILYLHFHLYHLSRLISSHLISLSSSQIFSITSHLPTFFFSLDKFHHSSLILLVCTYYSGIDTLKNTLPLHCGFYCVIDGKY